MKKLEVQKLKDWAATLQDPNKQLILTLIKEYEEQACAIADADSRIRGVLSWAGRIPAGIPDLQYSVQHIVNTYKK